VLFALLTIACSKIPQGRSAIDDVSVYNARTISPSDIEDHLATVESERFLGLKEGLVYDYSVFDEAALQRDLARVERYLRGRGFLAAQVRAGRVIHTSDDHVRVQIVVIEGPPTLNRNVAVKGMEDVPPGDQEPALTAAAKALAKGARFDETRLETAEKDVKRALTEDGYAYATVKAEATVDPTAHAADYVITIDAGPKATFGAVTIVGLDPDGAGPRVQEIPDSAVRRAVAIEAGQPFSSAKIDSATQALLDLGVFSAVQVLPTLSKETPRSTTIPVTVKLAPTRLRELKFGGGFEFDVFKTDLHLLTGWENKNFFGGLRDFTVEWRPGLVLYPLRVDNITKPTHPLLEERFRAQLKQPGFLEARTTGLVTPELNVFPLLVAPDPPANDPVVGYVEVKGTIGVERTFLKRLKVKLSYTVQVEDPFSYVGPLNSALTTLVIAYPQIVTALDYRDSPLRPHSGFYLANTFQVAGGVFGGDASDIKVQPEVRTYIPLGKRVTFGTRASVGFLFPLSYAQDWQCETLYSATATLLSAHCNGRAIGGLEGDIERMYFRGFFSGGPNTNRGFPLFGVSTYAVVPFLNPATAGAQIAANCNPSSPTFNPGACYIPVGGLTLWEFSNEIRYQIAGPFSLANFCDMGDVSPNAADIRLSHLHLSCGGGARYDTPVGPIRFDVGYRIQPLQILGFKNELAAAAANPSYGAPTRLFGTPGAPIAFSIGIGEAF
jgi:outer membrane protein insertion porin family/translocation and assembly module TamA